MRLFRRKSAEPLDLTPYEGNWVAVSGGRLIAYEPYVSDLIDRLERIGVKSAVITFNPTPEQRAADEERRRRHEAFIATFPKEDPDV